MYYKSLSNPRPLLNNVIKVFKEGGIRRVIIGIYNLIIANKVKWVCIRKGYYRITPALASAANASISSSFFITSKCLS